MSSRLHTRPSPSTDEGLILYIGDKAVASIEPIGSAVEPPFPETLGVQHYVMVTLEGPDAGKRIRLR